MTNTGQAAHNLKVKDTDVATADIAPAEAASLELGKSFPATRPYQLEQGQGMVVHYMNEGLASHPMHLHNNRQLVIAKDGFPLEAPYYADTVNVAPGERYTVVVTGELPGTRVWHCHILPHVEKSDGTMFGMLTALTVE